VAGIEARLAMLEKRITPPPEPNPAMERFLFEVNRYRAALDRADRETGERLEPVVGGHDGDGLPEPEPLTLDERREDLRDAEEFLVYLERERKRAANSQTRAAVERAVAIWSGEVEKRGEAHRLEESYLNGGQNQ
jgi:hypothetical protein